MTLIQINGFQKPNQFPLPAVGQLESAIPSALSHSNMAQGTNLSVVAKDARPSVVVQANAGEGSPPPTEQLLAVTKREAARLLSLSERTLFQLVADGEIPVIRLKRKVLFRRADLEAWLLLKSVSRNQLPLSNNFV